MGVVCVVSMNLVSRSMCEEDCSDVNKHTTHTSLQLTFKRTSHQSPHKDDTEIENGEGIL